MPLRHLLSAFFGLTTMLAAASAVAQGDAIAAEWGAQSSEIDPEKMPLTRLANLAIDRVEEEAKSIREEIVRLRAHLSQLVEVIHEPESAGRKLEFVVQEMGRETNTIGSKANDIGISRGWSKSRGCSMAGSAWRISRISRTC